jgi:hypothetical protein
MAKSLRGIGQLSWVYGQGKDRRTGCRVWSLMMSLFIILLFISVQPTSDYIITVGEKTLKTSAIFSVFSLCEHA